MADFQFSRSERRRIMDGKPRPIVRDEKPELEPGDELVLSWSREQRHVVDQDDGSMVVMPERPMLWITVTKIVRHRTGKWSVRYDVFDRREKALFLAPGSGYTTDVKNAVDNREAPVSEKDRARLATEARLSHAERQERNREARLRQERAHRASLRERLDALSPLAAQLLLAALEKMVSEWEDDNGERAA